MLIYQNVNSYPLKKCVTTCISFHVPQLQQTGICLRMTLAIYKIVFSTVLESIKNSLNIENS
jgi:hypothetical protein